MKRTDEPVGTESANPPEFLENPRRSRERVPDPAQAAILVQDAMLHRIGLHACQGVVGLLQDKFSIILVDHSKPKVRIGSVFLGTVAGHSLAAWAVNGAD